MRKNLKENFLFTPLYTGKNLALCIVLFVSFILLFVGTLCEEQFLSTATETVVSSFECPVFGYAPSFGYEASIIDFVGVVLLLSVCW